MRTGIVPLSPSCAFVPTGHRAVEFERCELSKGLHRYHLSNLKMPPVRCAGWSDSLALMTEAKDSGTAAEEAHRDKDS